MTGTFDNWSKTEKLNWNGSGFEKTVSLPEKQDKILYKVRRASPPSRLQSRNIPLHLLTDYLYGTVLRRR